MPVVKKKRGRKKDLLIKKHLKVETGSDRFRRR